MRSVLVISLVLAFGACSKPNPAACCVGADDCAASGLPGPKGCETGLYCSHNTCVPADCTVDADCPTEHPVCGNGTCVDCDGSHPCSARAPLCEQASGTCGLCTVDDDCSSFPSTSHCDSASGGCVECVSSGQCPATTPVCDQQQCRTCVHDSDCDSGACDVDGTCVPEQNVIYLQSPGGDDTAPCSKTSPCATLLQALAVADPNRHHISLAYANETTLRFIVSPAGTTATSLFIHGHDAQFKPAINSTMPMFDTKLPLTLRDMTLTGNVQPITTGSGVPLVLDHVTVHDTQHLNIAGPFTATGLTIYNNTDATAAIVATGGYDISIDGASISGGQSVLSAVSASHVHLKNMMVTGTYDKAFNLPGNAGELEFSTIAFAGRHAQTAPCSLACGASLHVTGTIIWEPICVNETANDAAGACTFSSSIVSNATPPTGTTNDDPLFVNAGALDFHIQPTSPARDAVATGPDHDFEGDPRPGGPRFDIGADEIP